MNLRATVHGWLSPRAGGRAGHVVDIVIMGLIAVNVLAVTLETVAAVRERFATLFLALELASVAVFSLEYVGRIWSAVEDPEYAQPLRGRLRFAAQPLLVIDLLAILPFYLAAVGVNLDLRFLRALRLFRVFRLLQSYSSATAAFRRVLRERKEKLVVAMSANFLVLLISSSLMYYVEHPAQPEVFTSIPATLWWGVVTLTTVGYGDVVPVTMLGQVVGAVVAVLGIGMFALPAALIATGFIDAARLEGDAPSS